MRRERVPAPEKTGGAGRRMDYDVLRLISMLCVVYSHTSAGALRVLENRPVWYVSNLGNSLAAASVPVFFMLSGALLLSQKETDDPVLFLKKRIPRVLLPLAAWSGLIILLTARGDPEGALFLLRKVFREPVVIGFWFLYALIPMYLIAPLLKRMTDHFTPVHWRYLIALWGIFVIGLNTLRDFLPNAAFLETHGSFNLSFLGGHLGYFLLGAALERVKRLPSRRTLWLVFGASFLLISAGTAWGTFSTGVYDVRFHNQVNVFSAVEAVSLLLLVRSYLSRRTSGPAVTFLSNLSFGVYLSHPKAINLGLQLWYGLFLNVIDTIPEQLLFYLCITTACLAGTAAAASVPGLCRLLTGQRFSAACRDGNLFAVARALRKKR